ncbi:hypothetical protein VP01_929g4 [Puccinia sorghi]|uniref:Tet-like 2OG-Fe(II) oxygenase domain-containing protein n=1 Tax=Puccinia sorghi TaxID=27349 RepID=A0A0L6U7I8_9BASI|nr:hypothetical protein VP01_929g4 [Puccinia sorghi]
MVGTNSSNKDQILGQYIKQFGPEDRIAFDSHYKTSSVGDIIGDLFKKLAHEPFQKNHILMRKYNLPSFSDLSYKFFEPPPHIDSEDIYQFTFYDVTSGPFRFPDHKFGTEFDHQHGIFKMIWKANN